MKSFSLLGGAVLALSLLSACAPGGSPGEQVGSTQGHLFTNGGFESGTAGQAPSGWIVQSYLNSAGITVQTPQTLAGLNLVAGGNLITTVINGTNQPDPDLGTGASLRWCRYGSQCARVNFHSSSGYGNPQNVNALYQDMTVGSGDVDPIDSKIHIRFVVAPVLQNPNHQANQQPYYFVQVTNRTSGEILYTDFNLSAQAGVPWKTINGGTGNEIDYVDWSLVDVSPDASKLKQGDLVRLEVIASGCQPSGHFGEVYVDGVAASVPGLFISGTGPSQVNPGSLVTYNLTYKNASSVPSTNVVINFTTPPNTTFQSLTLPPGGTCSSPTVGTAGAISCSLSAALAVGASNSFQVQVKLSNAATGQVVAGTYSVQSTEETPLIGSKIVTTIGCYADSVCAAGQWCNLGANLCSPTLANGSSVPSDPTHVSPTLNGACTADAGALVCTSSVCDAGDNKCGLLNGSGTCTAANQATLCRSGICDSDGLCGYGTSHGPCTSATATAVCRSGSCSSNLLCQPAGGCNVDADCTGGKWCNEASHVCSAKLTNGTALPTDASHTTPVLNGACTAAAATLVCQSAVCDLDNQCGYGTDGGPCTVGNQSSLCRSGSCSSNGLCRPLNGCNVDADCAAGTWCSEATHACVAQLANGVSIPSDVPHANPTLNGSCTAGVGALVCQAGVCDPIDNKCGQLNGTGSCTLVNQATVCRSGACDTIDGLCGYATNDGPCTLLKPDVCRSDSCSSNLLCQPSGGCNVDSDCIEGQWCNESGHVCTAQLTNGTAIPTDAAHSTPTLNGTCSVPAASLVCGSGVCDSGDNQCGYGTASGPCTSGNAAMVCRSGSCSVNGTCKSAIGCNVDGDCTGGNWCNVALHACTATLANGSPVPTDAPHTNPTLDGSCTIAAATLVCQSGTCDTDNLCGYGDGDGPCTAANADLVCRSGACSTQLKCRPANGCLVDDDCTAGNWCDESSRSCKSKLANGAPVPTDASHTTPTLNGKCSADAATLVCQSAVCDSSDNQCGYAAGDGPCTAANGASVCRSATCSTNGLCQPAAGCNVDADCAAGKWCNEAMNACVPTLDNGVAIPKDSTHKTPALNGSCTDAAAKLVCTSQVCDSADDECGLSNGVGPCTKANADTVCRSGLCATSGTQAGSCVACTSDDQCSGDTPTCNVNSGSCVACTTSEQCGGKTPLCDTDHFTCSACDGDYSSKAAEACGKAEPFCFRSGSKAGSCGQCAADADCKGSSGNVCNSTTGLCFSGCTQDSDCTSAQWCNDSTSQCSPKLDNAAPLPSNPARVATCTTPAGLAVCLSGVCDPADNSCGLTLGHGPCNDGEQCRSGTCDSGSQLCSGGPTPGCATDADCSTGEYCGSGGACAPLLPTGAACTVSSQCSSHDCYQQLCNRVTGSGSGVACATRAPGGSSEGGYAAALALLLAAAWIRRRRALAA